jgi:hypothetical protein
MAFSKLGPISSTSTMAHAPYLAMLTAADDDFRRWLTQFLDMLPPALEDLEAPISEEMIQSAEHVLRALSQSPHRDLRARSIRGLALLKRMSRAHVSHGLEMVSAAGSEDIGRVMDAPTRDDD